MMLLEFLADFDHFLADHLERHGNPGRENILYLSSSIWKDIINIFAQEVLKVFDQKGNRAEYYASVDSTPDI